MDKIERKDYYKDYADDMLDKIDELVEGYNEIIARLDELEGEDEQVYQKNIY